MKTEVISGILLTADNHKISFRHYNCGRKQVIVVAPGFFNSKDAELLLKLKDALISSYDVIMFDFRGHGASSGLFTWTAKEGLDLEVVLDYANKYYPQIGLIGFSLGGAISIAVLAKGIHVDSFICISAPSPFWKIDYNFWRLNLENDILYNLGKGRFGKGVRPGPFWLRKPKTINLAGKIKCPVLYIHGDRDWVVGEAHSQRLYDKTRSTRGLRIIKNGSHAEYLLRKNYQEVTALIDEWFHKTLGG